MPPKRTRTKKIPNGIAMPTKDDPKTKSNMTTTPAPAKEADGRKNALGEKDKTTKEAQATPPKQTTTEPAKTAVAKKKSSATTTKVSPTPALFALTSNDKLLKVTVIYSTEPEKTFGGKKNNSPTTSSPATTGPAKKAATKKKPAATKKKGVNGKASPPKKPAAKQVTAATKTKGGKKKASAPKITPRRAMNPRCVCTTEFEKGTGVAVQCNRLNSMMIRAYGKPPPLHEFMRVAADTVQMITNATMSEITGIDLWGKNDIEVALGDMLHQDWDWKMPMVKLTDAKAAPKNAFGSMYKKVKDRWDVYKKHEDANTKHGDESHTYPIDTDKGWGQYWSKLVHCSRACAMKHPDLKGEALLHQLWVEVEQLVPLNSWKGFAERTICELKFNKACKCIRLMKMMNRTGNSINGYWFDEDSEEVVHKEIANILAQLNRPYKSGPRANFMKLKEYVFSIPENEKGMKDSFYWVSQLVMPATAKELEIERIRKFNVGCNLMSALEDWDTVTYGETSGSEWFKDGSRAAEQIRRLAVELWQIFEYPGQGEPPPTDLECFNALKELIEGRQDEKKFYKKTKWLLALVHPKAHLEEGFASPLPLKYDEKAKNIMTAFLGMMTTLCINKSRFWFTDEQMAEVYIRYIARLIEPLTYNDEFSFTKSFQLSQQWITTTYKKKRNGTGVAVHDSPWLKKLTIWFRHLRPASLSVEEFGCTEEENTASVLLNKLIHMPKDLTGQGWSWIDWTTANALIQEIRNLILTPSPTPVSVRENLGKIRSWLECEETSKYLREFYNHPIILILDQTSGASSSQDNLPTPQQPPVTTQEGNEKASQEENVSIPPTPDQTSVTTPPSVDKASTVDAAYNPPTQNENPAVVTPDGTNLEIPPPSDEEEKKENEEDAAASNHHDGLMVLSEDEEKKDEEKNTAKSSKEDDEMKVLEDKTRIGSSSVSDEEEEDMSELRDGKTEGNDSQEDHKEEDDCQSPNSSKDEEPEIEGGGNDEDDLDGGVFDHRPDPDNEPVPRKGENKSIRLLRSAKKINDDENVTETMAVKNRNKSLLPCAAEQVGALTDVSFPIAIELGVQEMRGNQKYSSCFSAYKTSVALAAHPKKEAKKQKSNNNKSSLRPSKAPRYNTVSSVAGKAVYNPPSQHWIDVATVKLNLADRLSKLLMNDPYNIVPGYATVSSHHLFAKCFKAAVKLGLIGSTRKDVIIGDDNKKKTRDKALLEKSFATWNPPCMVTSIIQNLANLEEQIGSGKSLDMLKTPVVSARHAVDHPSVATDEERKTMLTLVDAMSGTIGSLTHDDIPSKP